MRMTVAAAVVMLMFFAACDSADEKASADPCPSPSAPGIEDANFAEGRGILDGDAGSTLIDVEIAETEEQHELGLMSRTCLDEDRGMVFIFFEETQGGFWMKNTLIPLSIAFFDVDGKILKILDMEPCKKDPCEVYDPGVPYMGALEVNQGAFDDWEIEEGDELHVIQNDRDRLSENAHSATRRSTLT